MVQLRKSRKSFRKTRGRKTRQRKNEKRKSRKTRSTRKTGGYGEEEIANNVYKLASNIGELVKQQHDKEQKKEEEEEDASKKIVEILKIFDWLTSDEKGKRMSNSCERDRYLAFAVGTATTCHRKKMIYYYIAIRLFMCFKKFILQAMHKGEYDTIYDNLIAKFEKHKDKYRYSLRRGTKSGDEEEKKFISGIGEKLYNSILKDKERLMDMNTGRREGEELVEKLVQDIGTRDGELITYQDDEGPELRAKLEKSSKLVEFIDKLKNLKIERKTW